MKGNVGIFNFIFRLIWIPALGVFIALESLTTPDHYRVFNFLLSIEGLAKNHLLLHVIDTASEFLFATVIAFITYKALRHLNKEVSFTPYWSALLLIFGGLAYLRPTLFKENAMMSAELLRGGLMLVSLWILYRLELAMAFSVWALGYTLLISSNWMMSDMASASLSQKTAQTDISLEMKTLRNSLKTAKEYTETREKMQERIKELALEAEKGDAQAQLLLAKTYLETDVTAGEQPEKALEKSIELISKASNQGNAEAQIIFADAYIRGSGIPINPIQAAQLYRTATQKSAHPDAEASLGWLYGHGIGVDWNGEEALRRYKVGIDADSALGYWGLADAYLNGNGVARNRDQGLYFLKKAADKHFPPAMTQLGWILLAEANSPERNTAAVKWIQDAARAGFAKAQYLSMALFSEGLAVAPQAHTVQWWGKQLSMAAQTGYADSQWYWGRALQDGWLGKADVPKASTFVFQSAYKNYHPALATQGDYYYTGLAGTKDVSKAMVSYQTAAQYNPSAMHALFQQYLFGTDIPKNSNRADYYLKQLRTLASRGDMEAQFFVAEILRQGVGLKADPRQAMALYAQSAENGYAASFYRLAEMAERGEGAAPDDKAAFLNYQKAARGLYLPAYYPVAFRLAEGRGIAKSPSQSQEWVARIQQGAIRGQADHLLNLAHCQETGLGVPRNETAAAATYQSFALKQNPSAMVDIARLLAQGRGVKRDPTQAYRWLVRANQLGHATAKRSADALLRTMPARDRSKLTQPAHP